MDSTWSWVALIGGTIAYWFVVVRLWLAWHRWSARRKDPYIMRRISENRAVITFTSELNLLRLGAVLLGPPITAFILPFVA